MGRNCCTRLRISFAPSLIVPCDLSARLLIREGLFLMRLSNGEMSELQNRKISQAAPNYVC
jgi:hypothetical protein